MDERAKEIGKTTAMYIVAVIAVIAIVSGIVYTSMTVYDKVTTETYTVTYDLNGGTGYCPEPVKVEKYEDLAVDLSDPPTREGYVFKGWSTDPTSTSGYNEAGEGPTFIISDKTLYAAWSPLIEGSIRYVSGYENGFSYKSTSSSYVFNDKPSSGFVYRVIEVTVTNHAYSKGFSPSYSDFELIGSDGLLYDYDYTSSTFNTRIMGKPSINDIKIASGGTYSFYIVYETPSDCVAKSVKYTGYSWGFTWRWA